ncbi:MAG TPA: hypothetical protein VLE47_04410 [Candidatus Saccharimonadales bacterium]|nr:hypothetical protein [Candidatus Saccharimonadales bacterium]
MSDHSHSSGNFGQGLFLGILVGVGLAMFLSTKEGERVKKRLLSGGEEILDDFSEKVIEFIEEAPESSQ